ncbi:sensor histidine kinase [Thermoactinospora rubra]|uniref:sensor histidine kinase n=1 Tax=Thermoactinospora rubra TaxID=1088767 RepID=UPI0011805EA9|nr:HAMP domain-containing sensor histidine kinase [Thermoactinospora rubra]
MRRRLVVTFTTLIVLMIASLAVPLGLAYSTHRTNRLLLDRRADATRFAELADLSVRDGEPTALAEEITRYAELYGAAVRVLDREGGVLAQAGVMTADHREAVRLALSGRTTEDLPAITPFGPATVLIAEPVGSDSQLSGVVLLQAPATQARSEVAVVWGTLALAAVISLGYGVLAARRLTRWIMRPVIELDRTTQAIAEGKLDTRAVPEAGPSELRELEERFNAMADAVSAAMERQRAFVADASHELRTPLTGLILRMENLEPYLKESGREEYEEALAEASRLAQLVDDLLALARIEAVGVVKKTDVAAQLAARLRTWREVYAAKRLTLTADLPASWTGPEAMIRIADIALDNAHKFVPEGGTVSVTLSGSTLRIQDDGPGLDAEQRRDALSRFWRSAEHANVPGSGLGLAIAAELAQLCGGTLRLLPAEPRGLVVEFSQP